MSISCPSLPLSLFDDILKIDTKYDESLKRIQTEILTMGSKLKENTKELEIIHKLFISLNERVNHIPKKEQTENQSFKDNTFIIEQKIDCINAKIDGLECRVKDEISLTKTEIKEYIDSKMEEIHTRLLKNLAFINEQQLKSLKIDLLRQINPHPFLNSFSPVISSPTNIEKKVINLIPTELPRPIVSDRNLVKEDTDSQWTKVDKKNNKPK